MKNANKTSTRKLTLSKQTLRRLDDATLVQAAGGISGLRCETATEPGGGGTGTCTGDGACGSVLCYTNSCTFGG